MQGRPVEGNGQRETDRVLRGTQAVWRARQFPPKRVSPVADATLHAYMFMYTPLHEGQKPLHKHGSLPITTNSDTCTECLEPKPIQLVKHAARNGPAPHTPFSIFFFFFLAGQRETRVQRLDAHNYVGPWFNAPWNRKQSRAVTHSGE